MKETVIIGVLRAGAVEERKGAFVEVDTNEGPRQLRFTSEDAERFVGALHEARRQLQAVRVNTGLPPLRSSRAAQRWETAMDPVEQTAVLRTHFTDGTVEQTHIPRMEIARIARFLAEALKRFESGAEMRQ